MKGKGCFGTRIGAHSYFSGWSQYLSKSQNELSCHRRGIVETRWMLRFSLRETQYLQYLDTLCSLKKLVLLTSVFHFLFSKATPDLKDCLFCSVEEKAWSVVKHTVSLVYCLTFHPAIYYTTLRQYLTFLIQTVTH